MKWTFMVRSVLFCFSLGMIFITACRPKEKRTVNRGFYFWKTQVHVSPYEQSYMDSLNTDLLYVRFFDVDARDNQKGIKPVAIARFGENIGKYHIVPVVFITPSALKVMNHLNLDEHAQNISELIQKKAQEINVNPHEVQIDCDWTAGTKDIYFEFLKTLRRQPFFKEKTLSVTIRLHQVKYRQSSGIPPADKGLLMVYNMDNISDISTENSIFNKSLAKDYLSSIGSYPLPLDIALPIFSWMLLFENDQLKGIMRDVKSFRILEDSYIFKKEKENLYRVLKDTIFYSHTIKKGQIIKYEDSDPKKVRNIAQFLSQHIKSDSLSVLLYHCDTQIFNRYKNKELEKIFNEF